jgi:hypothetical protein
MSFSSLVAANDGVSLWCLHGDLKTSVRTRSTHGEESLSREEGCLRSVELLDAEVTTAS